MCYVLIIYLETLSAIFISLRQFLREQTNLRMSLFLVILLLTLTFSTLSESFHVKNLPSAIVVGTVYCDTCSKQEFSFGSHFISGASVAVECKDGNSKVRFKKEVKTDEHGEFKVELPFSVRKHVKRIKGCTFKLVSSSEPDCAVASAATSSSLRIKSRNQEEHIFSAGLFSFKPTKNHNNNNNLCSQKPSIQNSKELVYVKNKFPPNIDPSFPPPLKDPPTPGILPPLPLLPPLSPLLPPLPEIPLPPPIQGKTKEQDPNTDKDSHKESQFSDEKQVSHPQFFFFPPLVPPLVPNPFQPPPLIPNPLQPPPLIPNPFQPPPSLPNPFRPPSPPLLPNPFQPPSPPPFLPNPFQPPPSPPPFLPNPFQPPPSPPPFLPNPFQPPPSPTPTPLFPFPPIPGLTPSPPPPPPPAPTFPFPPLFPPLFPPPHSPGSPPASL